MSYNLPDAGVNTFLSELMKACPEARASIEKSERVRDAIAGALFEFVRGNGAEISLTAMSHEHSMERILARGIEIATVIDIGASDGHWSALIQKRFLPDARFLLIEGYNVWTERLEKRVQNCPGLEFTIGAAGDTVGEIYMCKRPDHPTGGHAYHRKIDERYELARQTTVDYEVEQRKMQPLI